MVTAITKLKDLLLGRKAMTNRDSVLKSRDITLPKKVHIIKAMVFPVVMYGCESWTIKKAEYRRINAFDWRRLLRGPWTARRSNQLILKEINPEYSLKQMMLKLQNKPPEMPWSEHTLEKNFQRWDRMRGKYSLLEWETLLEQWASPRENQPCCYYH